MLDLQSVNRILLVLVGSKSVKPKSSSILVVGTYITIVLSTGMFDKVTLKYSLESIIIVHAVGEVDWWKKCRYDQPLFFVSGTYVFFTAAYGTPGIPGRVMGLCVAGLMSHCSELPKLCLLCMVVGKDLITFMLVFIAVVKMTWEIIYHVVMVKLVAILLCRPTIICSR